VAGVSAVPVQVRALIDAARIGGLPGASVVGTSTAAALHGWMDNRPAGAAQPADHVAIFDHG
jgi:hypothetical protein